MVAEVAHLLCTPIPALLDMEFDELALWHDEAGRIADARGLSGNR